MSSQIDFNVAFKKIQQEGNLAWEYNPFRNYRLDEDMIFYKNQFYTLEDFVNTYYHIKDNEITSFIINDAGNIEITYKNTISETGTNKSVITNWDNLDKTFEPPIFYQKGQLVDFITDELDLDLSHPIEITPTYSYDDSVDLIINDGKNKPKIINSRFSAIGKNKYRIVDRTGNNDTNIYDRGEQFDIDTSLYKITSKIPRIAFGGESFGGNLKIGNYHFYFKYSDLDGNESDFVGQSGLVSVFLGNTPDSITSGFRDENSNKKVRFILSNIDQAYDYIIVYYSRTSGAELQSRTTECCKIEQKYKISQFNNTVIDITGFETTTLSSIEAINERLQVYDSAKTAALSQNMLFLGNVTKSNDDFDLLSKLSLYIIPSVDTSVQCEIDKLNDFYSGSTTNTYYDPNFIYKYTGYWEDEIYRFGIVYIKNDNTLTTVHNIRGLDLTNDVNIPEYDSSAEITYNDTDFTINSEFKVSESPLENSKGVCYIPFQNDLKTVIGINFKCHPTVINKLRELGIKGFFIVRQKRIPTTLCQAYTIGIEQESHIPVLPLKVLPRGVKGTNSNIFIYESFLNKEEESYKYWDDGDKKTGTGNLLTHDFKKHVRAIPNGIVSPQGAICPDYDVNSPELNNLFTGANFTAITRYQNQKLKQSTGNERLFIVNQTETNNKLYNDVKIIGVEDGVKLVGIGTQLFSANAGNSEEAYRFEWVGNKVKTDHGGSDLVRGEFGPYLGITGYTSVGDLITIKIPGYNISNLQDYFKIRYFDASVYYPISDRIEFNTLKKEDSYNLGTFYRGDCYICRYTHRLNRNFRDQSNPTNDSIVDPSCWTHNMNFEDEVMKKDNLDKINLGDVNAVNLGMWVTFTLRSNINHSVRSLDQSYTDETALVGNCRGFYPYHPLSPKAAYKLPESIVMNKGFEAGVGEQIFEQLAIVPYYRDTYATRIAYSNVQIASAFKNAYRVFPATKFKDYPITYGEITKLIEWNGNLIVVLEHGIYIIPINERVVAGEGSGGLTYINTANVLPDNPQVISPTYGSQWSDSIIKTPMGVYGVDTVAKKIWKVDNSGMQLLSDHKVTKFLNDNITFSERELTPILGIRNVKTHYNAFKHDVMFTFYDDIHGADEVAWNLCWNEEQNQFVTFYSWIPSFSENIYNTYFSFDRETSKQIGLLAQSSNERTDNEIYLSNSVMTEDNDVIGEIKHNFDKNICDIKYELLPDAYNNQSLFTLSDDGKLSYNNGYESYLIRKNIDIRYDNVTYLLDDGVWKYKNENDIFVATSPTISKILFKEQYKNWKQILRNADFRLSDKLSNNFARRTYFLTVRITPTYKTDNIASLGEYVANKTSQQQITGQSVERIIAVIPKEHLEALSTDFWKHGQAGIIDIQGDIKPTHWYGNQHPFEFEFVVREQADAHKIFDNLIIISNKAAPESFHYEIVGECYEFAKDKKNMYIRQEATKELFQESGYNISYKSDYKTLESEHRPIETTGIFDKSTIFPAYYRRQDKLNTIEDSYSQRPGESGKDYRNLTGSEIVYDKDLNEFRIWTHQEGVDMTKSSRLRGNMFYKEDKWYIQISPIRFVQCNEPDWKTTQYGNRNHQSNVPIELQQGNFMKEPATLNMDSPVLQDRDIVFWNDSDVKSGEAKIKDKYVKIRIRYSGEDLAIISAIKTLYSISYA